MEKLGKDIYKCDCGEIFFSFENFFHHILLNECFFSKEELNKHVAIVLYRAIQEFDKKEASKKKIEEIIEIHILKNNICKN